jgi:hypothetical protein|uniref:Tail fiber protein n=1 Tax=Phage sp. ctgh419 TaxID=2828009 RepID=A0A8S5SLS5_9VIRU|nr:MAG TPA: hypothetical protein [Phage sp. ctgh419]DAL07498.1 MAG TPA: collagen alpha 1(VIII) chain protein [Caudoviricetes sp.]
MARILIGNIKGPQGDRGQQGERGPQGAQGVPGATPALVNNALATQAGVAALDAVMGKTLSDKIGQVFQNRGQISWRGEITQIGIYSNDPNNLWDMPQVEEIYFYIIVFAKPGVQWQIPVFAIGQYSGSIWKGFMRHPGNSNPNATAIDYTREPWTKII